MLQIEQCLVCNRLAPKDSEAWQAIKSRLPVPREKKEVKHYPDLYSAYNRLYQNALPLKNKIEGTDEEIQETFAGLNVLEGEKRDLEYRRSQKLREIEQQLQFGNITNAKDIINGFNSATQDISKYSRLIGEKENELNRQKGDLEKADKKLGDLSEGEVESFLKTRHEMLKDLVHLTQRTKQRKYKELLQLLETKANEHYSNINAPTGAFYGKIKFEGDIEHGYRPVIIDNAGKTVTGSLNTSQLSSMKISIIMAVVSANTNRGYNTHYPLIADTPVSDFDTVKTFSFLKEAANTFGQSIIIIKEMLEKDPAREGRYIVNYPELRMLEQEISLKDKKMKVFLLDMPNGISNEHRNEIEVHVKNITL